MIISSPLFEAYLDCDTKCWLRANAERGVGNTYAEWARLKRESYCEDGRKHLLTIFPKHDLAIAPVISMPANNLTWRVATDVRFQTNCLESRLQAVERVPSEGRAKPPQFIVYRFHFANKVGKNDKLTLAFDALVLSEALGCEAAFGKVIHGDRHDTLKVELSSLAGTVRKEIKTLDDAKAALQRVMKPYEYYKFEDREIGPLQVLAANLTALQRPYMKTAPMFVVNGVQAGTGKGQVCRAIGHLALATTPPFMSWGHDDDEFKKRFDTMLLASPAMLVMDNCNGRVLRGDTLEMILSEGEATIRQFNKLEAITIRSRTFLMANGNNIQISGDMSRRGIKINILPHSENPESDVFPFTPEDYVLAHREALLSGYYTIMRAFRHAGMPRSGLPAVGSFPEWERKVRDLIFWLTGHDLSGDFKKNKLDDPEQQEDAAVLSALRQLFREQWFKASEVDASLKRAAERRRPGSSPAFCPGPKTTAAMRQHNAPTIEELIRGMEAGTVLVDTSILQEIKDLREQEARVKMEAALLEAAEQKFGAKSEYAKTLGNWARGVQKKFIDGFILHRQDDLHSKIHRIKVGLASSTTAD